MKTISSISKFRRWRKGKTGTVGFVPTMGALHDGHMSLIEKSNQLCSNTIISIYVNPMQFSPDEDLESYPRSVDSDLKKIEPFNVDAVFLPNDENMYPCGFNTKIIEGNLSVVLEGNSRLSFFEGVTTIVTKLFNIVQPTHAFFGEKDAQQLAVIKKMVKDLNFPIEIVSCPIIREKDGLALSSRNTYLTPEEREVAAWIYTALQEGKNVLHLGERDPNVVREIVSRGISTKKLLKIDYVSVADSGTLSELNETITNDVLVSTAVFAGKTRLLDNFTFSI